MVKTHCFCGEHLNHVITIRGQILVSRTNDDPLPHRVYVQNALRVLIENVSVCTGTTRTCFNTCARGAGIHGDVLNVHTEAFLNPHTGFSTFFQRAAIHTHTHTHTKHTPRPQRHTHHTTPPHKTPHGDRDRERDRDRQKQRETEKERQRKRDKTRQEKRTEEKREDERQEKGISREEKREDKKREQARQEKRQDEET